MSGRYGKTPRVQREELEEPQDDVVLVEQKVTDIRGQGFASPAQEEELRSKGLAVCYIIEASSQALNIYVNGIMFKCPTQKWIRVPVSVKDVLENAGLL